METLAVVAYRQPVLRAEIEAVRGVQSGEVLRQLIERGFVRIAGRSKELGRPFLYGTTRLFLQVFGLRRLEELPRADVLRRQASPDHNIAVNFATDLASQTNQSQVSEEETNVKTDIATQTGRNTRTESGRAAMIQPRRNARLGDQNALGKYQADDVEEEELDDDDEDEDEDVDDEGIEDEPWEEVEDDEDFDEEDDDEEEWDEDDEWDEDEEEDWEDDDDDDWEDDDDDEVEKED